jgi:hypothetical protein
MRYDEWKAKYQKPATPGQQAEFSKVMADPNLTT